MWLLYLSCCCFFISLSLYPSIRADSLPECKEKEFSYTYTKCINQTRWRVAVPGAKCLGGKVQAPSVAYKCDTQCHSGQYMSPKNHDEKCEDCPGGTYSIRGGIRFDDWDELPAGFSTSGERGEDSASKDCSDYIWKPMQSYLVSPSGSACTAVLTYTVTMARAGKLELSYKFPATDDSLFTVEVENDQCEVNADGGDYEGKWIRPTKADKWATYQLQLGKGRNRVFFLLIDNLVGKRKEVSSPYATPSILIRSIEVTGVAFSQSCAKCRAGFYSIPGSTKCKQCEANSFSKRGSQKCSPCPPKSYSLSGFPNCTPRPKCTEMDYYAVWGPCDLKTAKMMKQYAWVEPKVCVDGVSLPPADVKEFRSCANNICNPGYFRVNVTHCQPCPAAQVPVRDQSLVPVVGKHPRALADACEACRPNTLPVTGLSFTSWWSLPEEMTTSCMSWRAREDKCPNSSLWIPMGEYIRSGYGTKTFFSILQIGVPGFNNMSQEENAVGHVDFEFELVCVRPCKLFFMKEMESKSDGGPLISEWDGRTLKGRKKYRVTVRTNLETKFVWLFQHFHRNVSDDHVKMYSINVTNAMDSPGLRCEPCHLGADKKCVACEKGKYFSVTDGACKACPPGQVVWRTPARSVKDCKPCGPGMKASNGEKCVIDFNFTSEVGNSLKRHNLDNLKGNQSVKGVHLFTTRSTEYHHMFLLTIDNQQAKSEYPLCQSNVHVSHVARSQVRALVCQYTLVPPHKRNAKALMAQPVSLGDNLVNVTSTDHSPAVKAYINKRLKMAGWSTDDSNMDIHLTYVTKGHTVNCPNGRSTLLTLRCDPKGETDRGSLHLPPLCPEGTCDGCSYHFLWKTRQACPFCNRTAYDVVKGECSRGEQIVYYYPPAYCYFSVNDTHHRITETRRCPLVSSEAEISIIVVIVLGIVLLTMLGYCWKRNKRLEYKYMKLVEGAGGHSGDLPQAESCAVHEGEDEEDDVHIKSGRAGSSSSSAFFTRFKNFRKGKHKFFPKFSWNNNYDDSMETVNLTDRDEFGL